MKKLKPVNQIKLVLLGETGVGKTSIMRRFINNEFISKSSSSIGIDYNFKSMKYNNKTYSIQIFDTAGQERFKSLVKTYYHIGDGFFIIFDLTNDNSLDAIKYWIESVNEIIENPKFIILGNKDDLQKNMKISDDVIKNQLENYKDIIYIKTSAKAGTNIKQAFEKMIDLLENDNNNMQIEQEQKSNKNIDKFK
jgi:small GTP-binding protein